MDKEKKKPRKMRLSRGAVILISLSIGAIVVVIGGVLTNRQMVCTGAVIAAIGAFLAALLLAD